MSERGRVPGYVPLTVHDLNPSFARELGYAPMEIRRGGSGNGNTGGGGASRKRPQRDNQRDNQRDGQRDSNRGRGGRGGFGSPMPYQGHDSRNGRNHERGEGHQGRRSDENSTSSFLQVYKSNSKILQLLVMI